MAQALVQSGLGLHQQLTTASPQALAVSLLVVFCPLLLLLARFATTAKATTPREKLLAKLPSPPSRLPVIGHLHLVGSLPHVSLRDLTAKHGRGGVMLLRLGAVPTLVVSSARAAQAVLRTHDHLFASRPRSVVTDILFYGSSDIAFSPYGEHWRNIRKIVTTQLLTVKKVRAYRFVREHEVRLVMEKIGESAALGKAVDLSRLLPSFTNEIMCNIVSGKLFKDEGRNKLFRELTEANSQLLGGFNLEDYFPRLGRLGVVRRVVCAKAEKVHKRWDDFLDMLIDGHASKSVANCSDDNKISDLIDVLLSIQQQYGLTRDNVKAILVDMFQAGTDTSSIVMEYAMAELMQKPCLMTKLQAEVRRIVPRGKDMVTEDDLNSMTYLKAVIKETLRLHPPLVLLVPHLCLADCDIEGYTIPAGTRVIINGWAIGRDASSWERADEFEPERFMEGSSIAAVDYNGNDFLFLPFGSGRRMCPGTNFAISTMEIMLANLMYHFDWKLPDGYMNVNMTESFGVTVHRKEKLLLIPVQP
ncbi:hypothetical protein SEVIR_7G017300v4 [Setaria viridis]|uniref:Indole-2-monooxygenase n=2 Tax=Setaria TaxID=4554 RepID=K3Y6G9_SETIT|nr:indole-2-monooxygenase [Setaria italica]XP_034603582.1 indole-2-monooxygenase-like [Setaria viridis]RCV32795.1 hypothetical protein SETIT_7G031500v2 [Setaria italica]TKW03337.1 hypothetical protein SEVIR_7G017300v2 [Setaria viridis]